MNEWNDIRTFSTKGSKVRRDGEFKRAVSGEVEVEIRHFVQDDR